MKTYAYTKVQIFPSEGVRLESTDSQILEQVLTELSKITTFKVSKAETISGETYSFYIEKLKAKGNVGYWILKQLCQQGWEPFGIGQSYYEVCFRHEYET